MESDAGQETEKILRSKSASRRVRQEHRENQKQDCDFRFKLGEYGFLSGLCGLSERRERARDIVFFELTGSVRINQGVSAAKDCDLFINIELIDTDKRAKKNRLY